jgi:hypothetical protein
MLHAWGDRQHQGGRYLVDYKVWDEAERREVPVGRATWADWDQRGRLVLARDGRLLQVDVQTGRLEVIADFNGRTPEPEPAPGEALTWPGPSR